jgi:lipopolysaccharide transport system permease protein
LFSGTLTKCSTCLVGSSQLISKVFFPRLVLPLSTAPSTLVDFVVATSVLLILMLARGIVPGAGLLLLPVWMAIVLLLALGLGLVSAALAVSYRDVQYMMPVVLQILLYASPVAYATSAVPAHLRWVYLLNPLSAVLDAFRWSLLGAGKLNPPALAFAAGASGAIFLAGLVAFKRMERKFADVI